jgi:F-type H+-transporting ATPase subunit b
MLEVKLPVLIFQIITFLVFVGALYYLLHKPVQRLLEARAQKIKDEIAAAEAGRLEAEKLRADYEARLREIETKAHEALHKALHDGDAARAKMLEDAQKETRRMIEEANAQVKADREKAMREMRHDIADLAVLVAERAARKIVDAETHQRLVQEFTQEVGKL